tara:strand:+ start:202975 stop:203526 length:552 start_codon:yes stop_codon:yes gene_type:complete
LILTVVRIVGSALSAIRGESPRKLEKGIMNGISAIGANVAPNAEVQGKRPPGPPPDGMRQKLDETAKGIVNDDGKSLFEARDAIMESVRAAMTDSDQSPETHRAAMAKALEENGFDPTEVESKMGPPPRLRGAGQRGGGAFDLAVGERDLGSMLGSANNDTADDLMQQLLSKLPAGSAVNVNV